MDGGTRRVFLTLVALGVIGCSAHSSVRNVDGIYSRAARSLAAGDVYHQIMTQTGNLQGDPNATLETWVDAAQGYARQDGKYTAEQQSAYGDGTDVIVKGNVRFNSPDGAPVAAVTCPGLTAAVATVLPLCVNLPGFGQNLTRTVRSGTWGGHAAVLVIDRGTENSDDYDLTLTSTLYLDPKTGLPIAMTAQGIRDGTTPFMIQAIYRGEFLKRSSATDNLFNPATVRWEGSPRSLSMNLPLADFGDRRLTALGVKAHA